MCCGSGAIGIALAKNIKDVTLDSSNSFIYFKHPENEDSAYAGKIELLISSWVPIKTGFPKVKTVPA